MKQGFEFSEKQNALIKECGELLKKMKENNIMLVWETSESVLGVINTTNIAKLHDGYEPPKEAVDVEDAVEWNVFDYDCIFDYDGYYGNLMAVMK